VDSGLPIVQVLRDPLVHAAGHAALLEFQPQSILPDLVKGLFHVNPHRQCVLLVLEAIFDLLGDVCDLVFSRTVLSKACLLWCNDVVLF
jgi:hypothetical protein